MANWYRSWPLNLPPELAWRPYVVDRTPRLLMTNQDYGTVAWPDHDLFLLEWDIALDAVGRSLFERFALEQPDRIATAGYYLRGGRWLTTGMGCIYLPRQIVRAFLRLNPTLWTDGALVHWYGETNLRVCDTVYPQHLNT